MVNESRTEGGIEAPKATRREWAGLGVLALPCVLYAMVSTALAITASIVTATLLRSESSST